MIESIERKLIKKIKKEKLVDLIYLHLRNLWAVDGLYFLEIEKEYGTEFATKIDKKVWEIMGKIEARKLKKFFNVSGDNIESMMKLLIFSGWALDIENKEIDIKKNKALFRNRNCRVQKTRLKKGLTEFGCKPVRLGFLKSFVKEFNPNIEVKCIVCPPDKHPNNLWCEWEFKIKEK